MVGNHIWAYDLQRDTETRLTFGPGAQTGPVWTPDGRYLVFNNRGGNDGLSWIRADGAGKAGLLAEI